MHSLVIVYFNSFPSVLIECIHWQYYFLFDILKLGGKVELSKTTFQKNAFFKDVNPVRSLEFSLVVILKVEFHFLHQL